MGEKCFTLSNMAFCEIRVCDRNCTELGKAIFMYFANVFVVFVSRKCTSKSLNEHHRATTLDFCVCIT